MSDNASAYSAEEPAAARPPGDDDVPSARGAVSPPAGDLAAPVANEDAAVRPAGPVADAALRALKECGRLNEERAAIAADLHDHVISRLFAAGLNLERVVGMLGSGRLASRLEATVDGLDETIAALRGVIGRLQQEHRPADGGAGADLGGRLLDVLAEVSPALDFEPGVALVGVDVALPDDVEADLLAVLRESLTNVARHAHASGADVRVAATDDRLVLTVTDDGTGIDAAPDRRNGLHNMARRARTRHGTFSAEPLRPTGTRVTWSVPLPRAQG